MILITGPMASGTRLLARLVAGSGAPVQHDTEHGQKAWPIDPDAVVVILRDPEITRRSWATAWGGGGYDPDVSRAMLMERYPDAVAVSYEALVKAPQAELNRLADALGLDRWSCPETVYDGNERWT